MSITIPLIAADGSKSTVTLPAPTVAAAQPTTITIGETAILTVGDNGNANTVVAQSTTLNVTATVQSLSFYVSTAAGQLYLGIYDATGPSGGPGALKATTAIFTPVVGWNTKPVLTPTQLTPGTYWLAYAPSSNVLAFKLNVSAGSFSAHNRTFAALPATLNTESNNSGTGHWSFYATLTTTGGPPPPPAPPSIMSITPNPGPAGAVTVTGANFIAGTTVSFGGVAATNISIASTTQLTCTAPAHANGAVSVTATTSAGTSTAVTFTYQAAVPPPPPGNDVPPTGSGPAPTGPSSGVAGAFDFAPLATNELWDNFDGPAGSVPDARLWQLDTINQGGIQVYDPSHAFLDGQGHLVLQATKSGSTYTSGRITSRGLFNMQYGRISVSMKVPGAGQGYWPAFWMLGVPYPTGEIDMLEMVNVPTHYYVNLHDDKDGDPGGNLEADGACPDLSLAFHEYWIDWKQDSVTIGMDNTTWGSWTASQWPPGGGSWQYNGPMYLIMNLAIGGDWAGAPNASTPFPAQILVDWFHYKPSTSSTPPATPAVTALTDLPRVPWEGGSTYWEKFPKAEAAGWSSSTFFPVGVYSGDGFDAGATQQYQTIGVNTMVVVEQNLPLTQVTDSGMFVIAQADYYTSAMAGTNPKVVGWFTEDECDMGLGACTPNWNWTPDQIEQFEYTTQSGIVSKLHGYNDGRFTFANFGGGVLRTYWSPNLLPEHISILDATSNDLYTYTSPSARQGVSVSPDWHWPTDDATIARSATYGWTADQVVSMQPADRHPHWGIVEVAKPFLYEGGVNGGPEPGSTVITPDQFEGAVWSLIRHESRGLILFEHNNGPIDTGDTHALVQSPNADKVARVTAVLTKVHTLASVINSQSYVWNFGADGADTMLKADSSYAYIFVGLNPIGTTGSKTFTLPAGVNGTSAEVLFESRTIPVSGGKFTDSFAAEFTNHIYKISLS